METKLKKELSFGNYAYNKEHMSTKQERQCKMIKKLTNTIKKRVEQMEGNLK